MKAGILFVLLSISSVAQATEIRQFAKTSADAAQVTIQTEEQEGVQAAAYVDAQENEQFIKMLLEDPTSRLSELKKSIENQICETPAERHGDWIDGCGAVELTPAVQTSFTRGGWMYADAQYTFFVGFRHEGTGHMFDASHLVVISEQVTVELDESQQAKQIKKYLAVDRVVRFPVELRTLPVR